MRLIYIGRLFYNHHTMNESVNPRLWNLVLPGHPQHQSTLALQTLKDLGLLQKPTQFNKDIDRAIVVTQKFLEIFAKRGNC